ncbi:PQQ-binding-like beta-propeller repeat protein [Mariniblastus fucicola]|uniref:Outer membrane biogenesis protein BamB n=1 Tax=Mariniblastus fucicola TaxID=980251 RepID=A0A5B9P5I9_9BACT|nr:PQQ-binding-like beta-propeller repeat protein [Mariniblastus fucicola]QEG21658.1 outer membrane biogenesis protein BamB [Mariniblastus fucicola]
MTRFTTFVSCFCLVASFGIGTVKAQQWTFYRGPNGDGTATAESGIEGKLKVHWKVPTEMGFSSFSISDGKALTIVARSGKEVCIALDSDNGKELWATELGSNAYDGGGGAGAMNNKGGDGPRSTPTIDGGLVYVYDAQMKLYCLDLATGNLKWSQDILKDYGGRNIRWQNATSPVVDEARVFVVGGGKGQSMIAFDKKSGDVVWKTGDEKMTHATPLLTSIGGQKQILFFMQSGILALSQDSGKEFWRTKFPFSVSTAASPVVFGDHVYGSAGYGVGAKLFKVSNGKAKMVWEKPNRLMNHWSTPVFHDGHLYGMFSFKKYGRGPLQCVDPMTGEVKWTEPGFGPGNCIVANGKVIALSDSGEIVIAKASPEKYSEISRDKVLDGKCWSMPALSDGKIYVRSTTEGACVSFE